VGVESTGTRPTMPGSALTLMGHVTLGKSSVLTSHTSERSLLHRRDHYLCLELVPLVKECLARGKYMNIYFGGI
jgi:hypothetical protein